MYIQIVGAGAIGLLFAGKMAAAGARVRLLTRTAEQAERLNRFGITLTGTDGSKLAVAGCSARPAGETGEIRRQGAEEPDWVFVTAKQRHLDDRLMRMVRDEAGKQANVLCFQNGIGHIEKLANYIPANRIYAAVTTEGARRDSGIETAHTGRGQTWIGRTGGDAGRKVETEERLSEKCLIALLKKAGFEAFMSKDIDRMIYRKLTINAVINPLTALFRIRNGELLAKPERLEWMRTLYEETQPVFEAKGVDLGAGLWEQILQVCRDTSGNTSSMLKDVENGAPTEIEWINGGLIRLAEEVDIDVPAHRYIYKLIKAI
ncbi:2-dehydropantoate 2-reductase [Paenibacillus sp. CECT 9249]|uniref:ketopantoate reductase family protein n=1 Tax=Paenibacillus sp. CECT 9249 TaxID=2845385 RepID=UPI001E31D093|nr:2-dehydropantoate 2-reductase [Paenibacillus sp. CECT 9249]CAH0119577.1 2-dehydropantoate 2-reductase [Paenibacillus sp. CECT 9249]